MITYSQQQWFQQAKEETMKIGKKNIQTRCQQFEKCVNEVIQNVNSRLNLEIFNFAPYSCSQIKQNCEEYLLWIDKIKMPQLKKDDTIESYLAMQNKVMARYNYMKSEHFADGFFPALFNSLFTYTSSLSQQVLSQRSLQQKQSCQSILMKLCCSRILGDKIEDFHQTKPTPLICERSVKIKSRRLNQLLKQIINKQQLNHMFPLTSYDLFPQDSQDACGVMKTLGDAEIDQYLRIYACDANTYNNNNNSILITPITGTNTFGNENLDEHSRDNNNDCVEYECEDKYNAHDEHKNNTIKKINAIQNVQEFSNGSNTMPISRNLHPPNCDCRNNYVLQRNRNNYFGSQELRFDPVVEFKMISNLINEISKKLEALENFQQLNRYNNKEITMICNELNAATSTVSSTDKNTISQPTNAFSSSLPQTTNLQSQEFSSLPPLIVIDETNHNQKNASSNTDISSFDQIENDILFDNHISKYVENNEDVNMLHSTNDDLFGDIVRQISFCDPKSLPPLQNWTRNGDAANTLYEKDEHLYRGIDLSHTNNDVLSPFRKAPKVPECEETIICN